MNKKSNPLKLRINFGLILALTLFSICLLFVWGAGLYFDWRYQNKILPRITVGGVEVGGLTEREAIKKINQQAEQVLSLGLTFSYQNQKITVYNSLLSLDDPDMNLELVEFYPKESAKQALAIGHRQNPWQNLWQAAKLLMIGYDLPIVYDLNFPEIKNIITRDMAHLITFPKNASLEITGNTFTIQPDNDGQTIDWLLTEKEIRQQLSDLENVNIALTISNQSAKIDYLEAKSVGPQIAEIIKQKPKLILRWSDKNWEIDWEKLSTWLVFYKNNDLLGLALDQIKLEDYLESEIKNNIDQPAQNAKFEIQNGRVVEFQGSRDGQILNINESIQKINNNFLNNEYDTELIISPDKAKVATSDINSLGITEIIGVGKSNFAGSPNNRRHNIKVGADALNGLLIKSGEEFSLVKALGRIDASTGYLPELVIKGNRTIPEYGGGLCQIGTTTFRATLASGLPILERRNHSYRVRYYEPAGTDATIYDPKPDYRFLNDSPNHILIQTRIEGDDLIFEFWGTKDGRQIEQSEPRIFNITAAPPTTYIETTDLKPGEKKCTESAHAGADAEFTYTVTYTNGEVKKEIFKSHYRPWGAVCLIGVEEISTPQTDEQTATNTDIIVN